LIHWILIPVNAVATHLWKNLVTNPIKLYLNVVSLIISGFGSNNKLGCCFYDHVFLSFSCVMDWGLASDWGIPPAPERKPIGYWGHQCDGDEPGLNYCCGADRRWIGTKHLTNSGFQRNHF